MNCIEVIIAFYNMCSRFNAELLDESYPPSLTEAGVVTLILK
jgi:hypothetical protein